MCPWSRFWWLYLHGLVHLCPPPLTLAPCFHLCVQIQLPAEQEQDSPEVMTQVLSWTYKTGGLLTLVLIIIWPLLALPVGIFTKG